MIRLLLVLSTIIIFIKASDAKTSTLITFNNSIKITKGWNIIGMSNNIEDVDIFLSHSCVLVAQKYKDGLWQEYDARNNTNTIKELNTHDGIFVFSEESCTLNNYGTRLFSEDEIKIQAISSN